MKLIDILVQELPKRGGWTDKALVITQDLDGEMCLWEKTNPFCCDGYWEHNSSTGLHEYWCGEYAMSIADDHSTAIITREQYEAALAAKNDGWIEWGGGKCPLHNGAIVDVKLRNGRAEYAQKALSTEGYASYPFWRNDGAGGDIIAYRLQQPQQAGKLEASEEDLNECIRQAQVTEWNGEELPPVGCDCECQFRGGWQKCTILFSGKQIVVAMVDDDEYPFESKGSLFRPIRSEADKKRDAVIEFITGAIDSHGVDPLKSAVFIYDAIAAGKVRGVKLED